MNRPSYCPPTVALSVIVAPGAVSKSSPSTPVETVVIASAWDVVGCVSASPDSNFCEQGYVPVIAPSWVEIFTSKAHAGFESRVESHVHQMCQWPPDAYSVNTPTPCPGAAVIVWFVSMGARIGYALAPPSPLGASRSPSGRRDGPEPPLANDADGGDDVSTMHATSRAGIEAASAKRASMDQVMSISQV